MCPGVSISSLQSRKRHALQMIFREINISLKRSYEVFKELKDNSPVAPKKRSHFFLGHFFPNSNS